MAGGLRIADGSSLRRVTTGNTMALSVVTGERAGDLLRREYRLSGGRRGRVSGVRWCAVRLLQLGPGEEFEGGEGGGGFGEEDGGGEDEEETAVAGFKGVGEDAADEGEKEGEGPDPGGHEGLGGKQEEEGKTDEEGSGVPEVAGAADAGPEDEGEGEGEGDGGV